MNVLTIIVSDIRPDEVLAVPLQRVSSVWVHATDGCRLGGDPSLSSARLPQRDTGEVSLVSACKRVNFVLLLSFFNGNKISLMWSSSKNVKSL